VRPPRAWGRRPPAKPANEVITGSREDASDPNPNRKTTPSEEGKSPTAKPANEVITGFGVGLSGVDSNSNGHSPTTPSACEPFREAIELGLSQGRNAMAVPLAIQLTGANRNASQQALSLLDAIPSLQRERGRPRQRPDRVLGDRGYDSESIRQGLRDRGIIPFLAKRNTEHGSGLADGAGLWNGPSHGGTSFGDCWCVTKSGRTFTRRSCPWRVP
jgi:hypothetical protein